MVYFFSRRADNLSDKVKVKVMPAWRALFDVLSQNRQAEEYQKISSSLLVWLELIDKIDAEVLSWVKESVKHVGKIPGYGLTLSCFIKALLKHVPKTPRAVGEIYIEIPQRVVWDLQAEEDEIIETIRILYNNGQKKNADKICNCFAEVGIDFLRPVYEEGYNNEKL